MRIGSERTTHRFSPRSLKDRSIIIPFSLVSILFATVLLTRTKIPETPQNSSQKLPTFSPQQPNPSRYRTNGTEVIYRIPNSPKAVLFVAHGCNLHAHDFWDKSLYCSHCTGLPEDRLFVLRAIELKMAVITISSLGKCWSFEKELKNVQWIVMNWVYENKLEDLPRFAMGVSSGGYFISALATKMEFNGICLMISEGIFEKIEVLKNYPPTLFVHMVKDKIRARAISSNMAKLTESGIEVKEIKCGEFPLNASFLANRIPGMDESFAGKIIGVFHEKGFIDEKGILRKDGRRMKWKEALMEKKLINENFELVGHVNEELNLAFSYHEFTSLKNDEIFEWFGYHMKRN